MELKVVNNDKEYKESLKRLAPLGVYEHLELKGINQKRRTTWAQVYDRSNDKFYEFFINRDGFFKYKGKRLDMSVFKRKEE